MEQEKMIMEMEAILEQEQIKIANTVEEFAKLQKVGITRCNAEALYNANCRVVHEDQVVLTKEELVKTMESGYVYDTTRGNKINLIEMAREIERKKTAKEYHDKFAEVIRDRDYVEGYAEIGMNEENDEILESFGVEVK